MYPSRITSLFLYPPCVNELMCASNTVASVISGNGSPTSTEKLEPLPWLQFMLAGVILRSKILFFNGPFTTPRNSCSKLLVDSVARCLLRKQAHVYKSPQMLYFILRRGLGEQSRSVKILVYQGTRGMCRMDRCKLLLAKAERQGAVLGRGAAPHPCPPLHVFILQA